MSKAAVTNESRATADPSAYPHDVPEMVSVFDVVRELRERLPNVPSKKLHKLLYYTQGHHLAFLDLPLFEAGIYAWDMGPVVPKVWHGERHDITPAVETPLGEAQLNTVGYVVSRYGALTGADLERLTHAESPWRQANAARSPHGSVRIEHAWLREFFRGPGSASDDLDDALSLEPSVVTAWLADAVAKGPASMRVDTIDDVLRRLA